MYKESEFKKTQLNQSNINLKTGRILLYKHRQLRCNRKVNTLFKKKNNFLGIFGSKITNIHIKIHLDENCKVEI